MSSENSTERKLISFIAVNKKIPTEINGYSANIQSNFQPEFVIFSQPSF